MAQPYIIVHAGPTKFNSILKPEHDHLYYYWSHTFTLGKIYIWKHTEPWKAMLNSIYVYYCLASNIPAKYINDKKWNAHLNIGSTTSYLDVPAPSFDSATIAGYLLVDQNPMGFGNSKDIGRERLHYAMFVT